MPPRERLKIVDTKLWPVAHENGGHVLDLLINDAITGETLDAIYNIKPEAIAMAALIHQDRKKVHMMKYLNAIRAELDPPAPGESTVLH